MISQVIIGINLMNYFLKKSVTAFLQKVLLFLYLSLPRKLFSLEPAENLDKMIQIVRQKWDFPEEESRKWFNIMELDSLKWNLGSTTKKIEDTVQERSSTSLCLNFHLYQESYSSIYLMRHENCIICSQLSISFSFFPVFLVDILIPLIGYEGLVTCRDGP